MILAEKTRVLIVDDDASMARYLSTYLSCHNFDVSNVGSGEEAVRMFRVYDPALVLLDVAMSGMNGIETLERIRQIKPDVSVIMLSAQSNPALIFQASKLGADDYISKPFEPKELEVRIATRLDYSPSDFIFPNRYLSDLVTSLFRRLAAMSALSYSRRTFGDRLFKSRLLL